MIALMKIVFIRKLNLFLILCAVLLTAASTAQHANAVSPTPPLKGSFYTDSVPDKNTKLPDLKKSTSPKKSAIDKKKVESSMKESSLLPDTQSALPGQYLQLDVLVPIYTRGPEGAVLSTANINNLKAEMAEVKEFYWRNSNLKVHLNIKYLTITRNLDISEFWNLGGNYWLTFWDTDGDGNSVTRDLIKNRVANNQYDGVFVFYAWKNNQYKAAYGGATYGVDVGFMGNTGYSSVPHSWEPKTYSWYFAHEFHHQISSMFINSGHPEFSNADQPWFVPGGFGENESFMAYDLRSWPVADWFVLNSPWGKSMTTLDTDKDGVPDGSYSNPLSLTEYKFGSNKQNTDSDADGLSDLAEAMAGIYGSSNLKIADTDADGVRDGIDTYPLYRLVPSITQNNSILTSQLFYNNLSTFTANAAASWSADFVTLSLHTNKSAGVILKVDVQDDGWFHGKGNYELSINPGGGGYLDYARVHDASDEFINNPLNVYHMPMWDDDEAYVSNGGTGRLINLTDFAVTSVPNGTGYDITINLPANTNTGFVPAQNAKYGFLVEYKWVDYPTMGIYYDAGHFGKYEFATLTLQ